MTTKERSSAFQATIECTSSKNPGCACTLLSGGISLKLATNVHHIRMGVAEKVFKVRGQRSDAMTRQIMVETHIWTV